MFDVTGRRVLVTGGSKGIGKGIARCFAKAGANVVIGGRDEASAKATADELSALGGGSVSYVLGDLVDAAACRALVDAAVARLGGLDVLCANHGIFPSNPLSTMTEGDIDRVLGTNVKGTILMVQAALPELEKSGRGRVILTSSITGPITGYPGWSHYGASKAAQLGFMRTASMELAPKNITCNSILPGNVATEGLADMGEDYKAAMEAAIPFGKLGTVGVSLCFEGFKVLTKTFRFSEPFRFDLPFPPVHRSTTLDTQPCISPRTKPGGSRARPW